MTTNNKIALAALFVAILGLLVSIFGGYKDWTWLHTSGDKKPIVLAYHGEVEDGRCPLMEFEIINGSVETLENVQIKIKEDWITKRGDESLLILSFEEALIPPGMPTLMIRRETLDIKTEFDGGTLIVPKLQPGSYIQRVVARIRDESLAAAKRELAQNEKTRILPAVAHASHDGGEIKIVAAGECL